MNANLPEQEVNADAERRDYRHGSCDVCGRVIYLLEEACMECWRDRYERQVLATAAILGALYDIPEAYQDFENNAHVQAVLALKKQ